MVYGACMHACSRVETEKNAWVLVLNFPLLNFAMTNSVITLTNDLHSTADEPLAETPPEEAAETPSAPLVEEEGKLGEGTTHFYSI